MWGVQGRGCEKDCLQERDRTIQLHRNHLIEVSSLSLLRWQNSSSNVSANNIEVDMKGSQERKVDGIRKDTNIYECLTMDHLWICIRSGREIAQTTENQKQ